MRTAACLLLIVSLVGVPCGALLARGPAPAGSHQSALTHQAQPPMVRANTGGRLLFPRFCTFREESCDLRSAQVARIGACLSRHGEAAVPARRAHFILRI